MQTRSLKLRLKQLIDKNEHLKRLPREKIAEHLGLASQVTVRKYLRNEARVFERRVLERACDWLNVDIGQLLELVPCNFFPNGDKLLRLCSKPDSQDDFKALGELNDLFSHFPIEIVESQNPGELARHVYEHNCVIVGSPHHNSTAEIALCTLFSADPGDTSEENRRKLPLTLEAPLEWQRPNALVTNTAAIGRSQLQCHVMVPDSGEKSSDLAFEKKSSRAIADFYPVRDFQQASFGKAKDFGIILVADHWTNSKEKVPVRTYWLSGFSSTGTLASLSVLQDDVRSFNLDTPQDKPGEFVLSIIQATCHKESGSLNRVLNDYEIVHTIRGSLPRRVRVDEAFPPRREPFSSVRARQPETKRGSK